MDAIVAADSKANSSQKVTSMMPNLSGKDHQFAKEYAVLQWMSTPPVAAAILNDAVKGHSQLHLIKPNSNEEQAGI
eukprot:CAMPEP_0202023080 /NCGR_PEP_ID=MMETSP0905-20130828/51028_1 /ASSEMBLY_ACC=CAM_ASM_000554 /TAXON_ID=420261 /ORGANISM="Thalassiosira antarctica, Strain CCMP982" /LENGTH=75 /DNA_ID=CAMNT_0048585377 /DNA_START=32 /DNA_END=257 /DNA_ORIENTATION=+